MNREHCAYLDIETSWTKRLTVIGVYRPFFGTVQLVAPRIDRTSLIQLLEGVETLCTFNGASFDLPVIRDIIGVDLTQMIPHRDLLHDCRRQRLKGGLKAIEKNLGIHRDTDGLDGIAAMNLWDAHQRGSAEALDMLLRYNREDVENLEILCHKMGLFYDTASAGLSALDEASSASIFPASPISELA